MAYRNPDGNEITDFEVIPILFHHNDYLPPKLEHIARIKREIDQTTQMKKILGFSRLEKFLQTLDDTDQPKSTPFGNTDMGWLMRHWDSTAGGKARVGWHNSVAGRGSGGLDNWHYNRLLFLLYNYVNNPNQRLFEYGYRQVIAHACYGHTWFGPNKGFARYEKGDPIIGQNFSPKAWEKQWSNDLITWHRLTGDEILGQCIENMRRQLKASNPDTVWQGYWGARRGARYLEELLVHYLHHREQWIVDKGRSFSAELSSLEGG